MIPSAISIVVLLVLSLITGWLVLVLVLALLSLVVHGRVSPGMIPTKGIDRPNGCGADACSNGGNGRVLGRVAWSMHGMKH